VFVSVGAGSGVGALAPFPPSAAVLDPFESVVAGTAGALAPVAPLFAADAASGALAPFPPPACPCGALAPVPPLAGSDADAPAPVLPVSVPADPVCGVG
jgi:hypothetical protein